MDLPEIVSVQIQAGQVNPARAGFGVPLIMAYHTAWSGSEVRRYTTFSGVAADFDSHEMPYLMAAAIFAQPIRPTAILIGRLPAPGSAHTTMLDFADMASGTDIEGSVILPDGTATTIDIAWNTDIATTLAALKAFLDPLTGIGSSTIAGSTLSVPADSNGPLLHFSLSSVGAHVRDVTADWDYDDALTAAAVINPTFYAVLTDCNSPKNMDKVARWTLANDRIAFFGPQYTKPAQFASGEFTAGADLTALQANDAAVGLFTEAARTSALEAAWVGRMLPLDPGSATWALKALEGVGGDLYTATERAQIESAGANHYTETADIGTTWPGKAWGGEWIDVVIGLAWLEARLQEALFAALAGADKIPYTDAGLSVLTGVVAGVLQTAQDRDVIDAGWRVTITDVESQETADRAARIVRGLEFTARLAGAVHNVNVTGTVTA